MRIIAGQRRGHKFEGPAASADLRPTSDMVREALFNILGALLPGRTAVDLFAGTGALGLEAVSRGAARAVFIERTRDHVGLIHRNIATLRFQDRAEVHLGDAYRWGRSFQARDAQPMAVFLDPPHRDFTVRRKQLLQLLSDLVEKLPPGSVIALEARRALLERILPGFAEWDIRRYGDTQIAIRVLPADQADGEPSAHTASDATGGASPGEPPHA